jgi:hypothetical protein
MADGFIAIGVTPFRVTLHHPAIAGKVLPPDAQRRAGVPPLMFAGVDGIQGARPLITHDALVFTPLELDLVKTDQEGEVQTSTNRCLVLRLGQI